MNKTLFWFTMGILFVAIGAGLVRLNTVALTGAGYKAKIACSEIFLAGRAPETVLASDFADIHPLLDHISVRVDAVRRQTTASLYGLGRSRAFYRDGYGCTLLRGTGLAALPDRPAITAPAPDIAADAALSAILTNAIDNDAAGHRAFAVMKDGRLAGEAYAEGFGPATPMLGWSMAKSVTAAMMGAAVHKGYVSMDAPVPAPEWQTDYDQRQRITFDDLMHMHSGLMFVENYEAPRSDVNRMLFQSRDVSAVPIEKATSHPPREHFAYSSGTTNLLQAFLKRRLEAAGVDYHTFLHTALLAPIGASGATFEPDASGLFVGSSFFYASARDWARLGQLFLNNGVWDGKRILPPGWSDYVSTPHASSDGAYGAHFWLNRATGERPAPFPGLPESAYFMSGHDGQFVVIIPSHRLVIVRLGVSRNDDAMALTAPVFKAVIDHFDPDA